LKVEGGRPRGTDTSAEAELFLKPPKTPKAPKGIMRCATGFCWNRGDS